MILFKAKKMARAIENDDVAAVAALLDAGVSPDAVSDGYWLPPLQRAIEGNHVTIAEILIDRHAWGVENRTYSDRKSRPMFAHAVHKKNFEMAEMLLRKKPELLNTRDGDGKTPLAHMAEDGNIEGLKFLLAKDADTTIKTTDNRTPYFLAQKEGRQDIVDLLAPYYVSPVEKVAVEPVSEGGWKKLSDDRIASVTVETAIGYKITEIFNFTARERRTICLNIESQREVIETKGFDEIMDKTPLENALTELKRQGGTADPGSILGMYKSPRL